MNRRALESMLMRMKFELDILDHRIVHHTQQPNAIFVSSYESVRTDLSDACHKLMSAAETLRNAKTSK